MGSALSRSISRSCRPSPSPKTSCSVTSAGRCSAEAEMRRAVAATAEQYHFQIDPDALVGDLAVGQQQRVEILKALYRGCRMLILDEPTAVLTPRDTASLFDTLRELQQDGLVGHHHHPQAGRSAGDQPARDRAALGQGRRAGRYRRHDRARAGADDGRAANGAGRPQYRSPSGADRHARRRRPQPDRQARRAGA